MDEEVKEKIATELAKDVEVAMKMFLEALDIMSRVYEKLPKWVFEVFEIASKFKKEMHK